MLDPFPIPVNGALANLFQPLSEKLQLWSLPLHVHEVLLFATFYTILQVYISPPLSRALFPKQYNALTPRSRINWDIHVVSFVQSILVSVVSLWSILNDRERAGMVKRHAIEQGVLVDAPGMSAGSGFAEFGYWERVFGYTGSLGLVQAAGCGYFLWDLWVSARYIKMFGIGILAHAVSALTVFSFGFRPFVNYYAPSFLLYELSSPFLNIHWFCDKLNLTGSKVQLYNGFLLLGTFMFCRLFWGTYASFSVFYDIYLCYTHGPPPMTAARLQKNTFDSTPGSHATSIPQRDPSREIDLFMDANTQVPLWMAGAYLASNLTLNSLNWFWFGKMIETIRKRFPPPFGTLREDKKEVTVGRGVYADGHKSVEVDSKEVKRRPNAKRLETEQEWIS